MADDKFTSFGEKKNRGKDGMAATQGSGSGGCPVDHKYLSAAPSGGCPVDHSSFSAAPPSPPPASATCNKPGGGCPVDHKSAPSKPLVCDSSAMGGAMGGAAGAVGSAPSVVNDVFPDAAPIEGQRYALSTTAVKSIIPKSGTDDPNAVWEFPSLQRFYNAMSKKGWNPQEHEIPAVVSIHNTVNERCWREILKYEAFHSGECAKPKLARFKGRPNQYSPKARFWNMFGYVLPFDRHDWTVDRCGKEVRYVIDFYEGKKPDPLLIREQQKRAAAATAASTAPTTAAAATADPNAPPPHPQGLKPATPPPPGTIGLGPTVYLDVRPAVSFEGVIDRMRMAISNLFRS